MELRRLGWAGIEVVSEGGSRAVVDLVEDVDVLAPWVGAPRDELPPPAGPVDVALVTHLHADHCDPAAIARALRPDGPRTVLRPAPSDGDQLEAAALLGAEAGLREHGLGQRVVAAWETVELDGLRATAVPAVDGLGDPQVSWVLDDGAQRVLHAGDTLFHGWWWAIARRVGPIDVAVLPVNAARVDFPHRRPPSGLPAAMGPVEAAAAAAALGARVAVPVHHSTFASEEHYVPVEDAAEAFAAAAAEREITAILLEPGEQLSAIGAA